MRRNKSYEPLDTSDEVSEDEPNEFEFNGDEEVQLDFERRESPSAGIYESIEDELDLGDGDD